MKKTLTLMTSLLLLGTSSIMAQIVPEVVKDAFAAKYPGTEAHWEADDGTYEADFKEVSGTATAVFSPDGTWLETERRLEDDHIPSDVMNKVKENYANYSISEAETVESANEGNYTELELQGDGKTLELKVFPNGKMMVNEADENDSSEVDDD